MMKKLTVTLCLLTALGACEDPADAVLFEGHRFRGKLDVNKEDRRSFTAQVSPVSQSLAGAREAARYEGTAHCVRKYGTSEIDWTLSPDAERTGLSISEDDVLTVQGRCKE